MPTGYVNVCLSNLREHTIRFCISFVNVELEIHKYVCSIHDHSVCNKPYITEIINTVSYYLSSDIWKPQ